MRQDQLVAGPGHRHVAEPPLLGERQLGRRRRAATETGGQGQRLAPAARREAARDEAGQEDDRELEALGLVDGQDGDRVDVGIEVGGRRVVAGLDERLEVRRDEDRAVVGQQRGLAADDLEEPGDVAERLLGRDGVGGGQPGQQSRSRAGTRRAAPRPVARGRSRRSGAGPRRARWTAARVAGIDAQDPGLSVELLEDRPHRPVAPAGHVDDGGQVLAAEPVDLGGREGVQVDARLRIRDDPQEREQEADLGPRVQARTCPRTATGSRRC